tara:strand:+ start:304 stop:612 length:309 start_codon:yes stop_codon:yes gene_type:complete
MKQISSVDISTSKSPSKKLTAIFYDKDGKKVKTTHFGSAGMSDYTINKDPKRKKAYIDRHRAREDWTNPISAGALSRWILWEDTNKSKAISMFGRRFNLKIV